MLTIETKILRSDIFAQVILSSVTPMFQNLRIGLRKRRNDKSKVPAEQRGGWLSIQKFKEKNRAAFFSLSENGRLPASSNQKLGEREFVVDSGASMHMISIKDLNSAEMYILTKLCSPTTVITANGEVQTHEEAIVCAKELDIFLTMKVLENTPAVLSLGKLCDENGYSHEWINGQKPHFIWDGIQIQCNTENFAPIEVPGLSSSSSSIFPSSTSMTPSRQESDHPTSSSSSSTSPTMTVSSDGETRARDDMSGIETKTTRKNWETRFVPKSQNDCKKAEKISWVIVRECRDSHASSSHEVSVEPIFKRSEDLGKHSVNTHFPKGRNCEICQRT